MSFSPRKRASARRVLWLVLITAMSFGLLIWGKLQLKKVPRTAVAEPEEMQPLTPVVPIEASQTGGSVAPVEKSRPDQADGKK